MCRVRLSGQLTCQTAQEAALVRAHLPEHIRLTRAEAGCLSFTVTETSDPLIWQVDEVFTDDATFAAHQARAKASHWALVTASIARKYEITRTP